MKTVLMPIDIQIDYFPGGAMEFEGSPESVQGPLGSSRICTIAP